MGEASKQSSRGVLPLQDPGGGKFSSLSQASPQDDSYSLPVPRERACSSHLRTREVEAGVGWQMKPTKQTPKASWFQAL